VSHDAARKKANVENKIIEHPYNDNIIKLYNFVTRQAPERPMRGTITSASCDER